MMKREFLVEDMRDISDYLSKNSLLSKLYRYKDKSSYMYKFSDYSYVLEVYDSFQKLILISKKDTVLDVAVKRLQEITCDERYSKEQLELFGNPKNYEFDEKQVFAKCDKAGLSRLDLHFKEGMSSAKVFRVILYRLNQLFTLEYVRYINKEIKYEKLKKIHLKFLKALKYSKNFFVQDIIMHIRLDFEELYMLLKHRETLDRFILNFQSFVHEEGFYDTSNANKPIYFFENKKKLFELIREL